MTPQVQPRLRYKAIAAMSQNRVIGDGPRIPWHIPEDFEWFKRTTMGHMIVMGRKTFESIGRLLPGRDTVVLSRSDFERSGVVTVSSLEALQRLPLAQGREIFICGGAQVYEQALPLCSDLYLTRVKRLAVGDAFFPAFEDKFHCASVIRDALDFRIEHWRNNEAGRETL